MSQTFSGFPKELFLFLQDLAENNNRDWFTANKSRYEDYVVEPILDFIEAMQQPLADISLGFSAIPKRQGGSMFRIYRDTRFGHNKKPYKENAACHFRHNGIKGAHSPGFYLHIEPGNCLVGAGVWKPENQALDQIRTRIAENPAKWQSVIDSKILMDRYGQLEGESLKRPPRGYSPDHQYIKFIKMKSFFLMQPLSQSVVLSNELLNEVVNAYQDSQPLMEFICDAMELKF